MALVEITIDFDLHQLLGADFDARRTKAYVTTNVESGTLMDTSTGETRLGDEPVIINSDGTGSFTTWATGADGNPISWQTSLVVDYPRTGQRDRKRRVFGPWTLTTADDGKNITALEDEQAVPAEYLTSVTTQFQTYVDSAQAASTASAAGAQSSAASATLAQTLVTSDLGTTDGQSFALVTDPNSQTGGALEAMYGGVLSVKDPRFGAVGNGVADDTAAIQMALNAAGATGGAVYLPPGTYLLSSALNLNANGVTIRGANREKSHLRQTTANAKILNNTAQDTNISDLRFSYSTTPTAGGVAIYSSGANAHFNNIRIVNGYTGIEFTTGTGSTLSNAHVYDCESIGIYVHDVNDVFISKFLLVTSYPTKFALGAIRIANRAEAIIFTDGDTIGGAYPLATDATTYGVGTRPAYNNFTNVFFDSAVNGALISKMVETEFVGCWFSNGRSGAGQSGAIVQNSDSITFTGSRFFNNGGHGCQVVSTALRTVFVGCKFESNSYTAGSGVAHGLNIAAGTTDFIVSGCVAHNGLFGGQQGRGVLVNTGASDRYAITNNLVSGNVTAGVTDSGTGTNKTVSDNW